MNIFVFAITIFFSGLVLLYSNAQFMIKSLYIVEVVLIIGIAWWVRCHLGLKWLLIFLLSAIAIFDFISSSLIVKRELFDGWYAIYPSMLIFGVLVNQAFYWINSKFFNKANKVIKGSKPF